MDDIGKGTQSRETVIRAEGVRKDELGGVVHPRMHCQVFISLSSLLNNEDAGRTFV